MNVVQLSEKAAAQCDMLPSKQTREIIKSCLNYTRKATEERERLEKKKNDDEAIKKVLIERYLKNEK